MPSILIVGASRGIGLALAKLCISQGYETTGTCRRISPAMQDVGGLEIISEVDIGLKLDSLESGVKDRSFDNVVVVSGVMRLDSLTDVNLGSKMLECFEVNAVGPMRVLQVVLPSLKSGSKFAVVTSRMGSISDNTSGGRYAYRASKCAVNMCMVSAAQDLKEKGIICGIIHPGLVSTDMTDFSSIGITPEESSQGVLGVLEGYTHETSGKFYHMNGQELPW
ncbi:MAG: hypothetical protein KVP17_000144 [Porospora cf. gigantea B]|uniref:uncharacterized protein n=1 Tax=Porospora cf. gigantea B TaxID=2853592 RepID=UPI003571D892|nr:MAG: hypothetical protein KVP17_000144 [Porospora cf. gigantea B]